MQRTNMSLPLLQSAYQALQDMNGVVQHCRTCQICSPCLKPSNSHCEAVCCVQRRRSMR